MEEKNNQPIQEQTQVDAKTVIIKAFITFIIFGGIIYGFFHWIGTPTQKDKEQKTTQISVNIDNESKENIKKLYSKISGYDSSNIIKAMYWKLADGTPSLMIAYTNTSRNGMYITINGSTVNKCYGDEEDLYKGSGRTKRESKELMFSMYKDDKEHIYLTGDEFRSIIQ